MLYSTSIRYEFSDGTVALAVGPASRKNVAWIDLLPARSLLQKCLPRRQGSLCTSIRPENALLLLLEARILSFRGLPTADSVDLASRRTFATGLYVGKVLLRAIPGSVPEAPLAAAISPPPVCGEVPCRSLAEFRHGRRVGPFQQAGLWPVYELGRPAATRPARPERMRGHQGPESIQA